MNKYIFYPLDKDKNQITYDSINYLCKMFLSKIFKKIAFFTKYLQFNINRGYAVERYQGIGCPACTLSSICSTASCHNVERPTQREPTAHL